MPLLSAFEVLAETLVPPDVAKKFPPGTANPFAVQGYWVQISLAPGYQSANFNVIFQETTDFTQGGGQSILQAQFIDAKGQVNVYTNFFASTGRGFLNQSLFAGQTAIYGIQALPGLSPQAVPQGGTGWRGTVQVNAQQPGTLIATPTQRLVYYNTPSVTGSVIDAVVYAVPTYSGGTRI